MRTNYLQHRMILLQLILLLRLRICAATLDSASTTSHSSRINHAVLSSSSERKMKTKREDKIALTSTLFDLETIRTRMEVYNSFRNHTSRHHRRTFMETNAAEPRIVGGTEAAANEFPWFAYWDMGCGATVIARDMLLSAAHCYVDDGNYGTVYINSVIVEGGEPLPVLEVYPHPQFNGDYYYEPEYDFILLKVGRPIVPDLVPEPVKLNDDASIPSLEDPWMTVIGFGATNPKGSDYPDMLRQVDIPYVSMETCAAWWEWTNINPVVELCTYHPDNDVDTPRDSCSGDSGGPLLKKLPDGSYVQVAIVSWGDGGECGAPGAPAISSRVSAVTNNWIRPQVCTLSSPPKPEYCGDLKVDLPMSLVVGLAGTNIPPKNISWGLYQISPPTTLYEIENGVVNVDSTLVATPPQVAAQRRHSGLRGQSKVAQKEDKNNKDKEDDREQDFTNVNNGGAAWDVQSKFFQNLTPGKYYFRIKQDVQDRQQFGTFDRLQVIQGSRESTAEHAWVDTDGQSFHNFLDVYMDLQPTLPLSELNPPIPIQVNPNGAGTVIQDLTIDIKYDDAPTETAWELRNLQMDQQIFIVPQGNHTKPGLATYTLEVPVSVPDASSRIPYQFRIWDSIGDGICCTNTTNKGDGWVQIWLNHEKVWQFDGVFQSEHTALLEL